MRKEKNANADKEVIFNMVLPDAVKIVFYKKTKYYVTLSFSFCNTALHLLCM